MTFTEQINRSILLLQDAVADVTATEEGKIAPAVRARKNLLDVSKALQALRKDILESTKIERAKRKEANQANPKKRQGFQKKS